jgi:hypothetical protein
MGTSDGQPGRQCLRSAQAARSRRKFLTEIAGTGKYVLPIHFPHPTTGLIEADSARFRYKFVR